MRICGHKTEEGIKSINNMQPALSAETATRIFNYSGTSVYRNPRNGRQSSLYQKCLEIFKDSTLAAQVAASAYGNNFISMFGDWIHMGKSDRLDSEGMPKLFFKSKDSDYLYTSFLELIYDKVYQLLIKQNVKEKAALQLSQLVWSGLRDCFEYQHHNEYRFGLSKVFYTFSILSKFDIWNSFPEVEIGFASKDAALTDLNQVRSDINFIKVASAPFFNFKQLIDLFEQIPLKDVATKTETYVKSKNEKTGKDRRLIDFDGETASFYHKLTFDQLKNAKASGLKELYRVISTETPEYAELLRNDTVQFYKFVEGILAFILNQKRQLEPEDVRSAIKYAKRISDLLGRPLNNFKYLNNPAQLRLFVPEVLQFVPRSNERHKAELNKLIEACGENISLDNLLKAIGDSDSKLALLAKTLIGKSEAKINFIDSNWNVEYNGIIRETCGEYDHGNNTINISRTPYLDPASLIIHEALHSLTLDSIRSPKYAERATKIFEEAKSLIFKKYNTNSIENLPKRIQYGLSSIDEFYSELWTNSDFIKELNSVGPKKKKSLLSRIKDFLLDLLGIKEVSEVYDKASALLEEVIQNPVYYHQYTQEEIAEINSIIPEDFPLFAPEEIQSSLLIQEAIQHGIAEAAKIEYNALQLQAIEDISEKVTQAIDDGDRVICRIIGKAGTGKTTVVPEIIDRILKKKRNLKICVSAVANQAKNNLASKFPSNFKIDAKSIAALIGKTQIINNRGETEWIDGEQEYMERIVIYGRSLDILVVDEASMLDDKTMDLLKTICPKASIIYIGDKRQLRSISKDYTPVSAFSVKDVDYSIELLERVRQGEGAPILDLADVFGDISAEPTEDALKATTQMVEMIGAISQEHNALTDSNALLSVNDKDIQNTVDVLMPIIREAIATQNTNKLGIVPFHIAAKEKYNDYIRYNILKELGIEASVNQRDSNYVGNIPYQPGEIIILEGPYKDLDNGLKLIIDEAGQLEDSPAYNIPWRGQTVKLKVFAHKAHYVDERGDVHHVIIKTLQHNSKLLYNERLQQLKDRIQIVPNKRRAKRDVQEFKELFAEVSPAWALNIHKAQGQTYEISYIPVDDYIESKNERIKAGTSYQNVTTQFASGLYTAITRASNITILGSKNYTLSLPEDITEINEQINNSKKSVKSVVKQAIEETSVKEDTPVVEESRSEVIPNKFRRQYDFLYFVTGSDTLFRSLKTKEGLEQAKYYAGLLFQRETELIKLGKTFGKAPFVNGRYDYKSILKDPKILFSPITEEKLAKYEEEFGPFKSLESTEVKSAQAVLPKQYAETFMLGSHSLAEINPSFFRHVNNHYWSKVDDTDFLVRTHNSQFNIVFAKDENSAQKYGERLVIEQDALHYRLDAEGNRMYQLPDKSAVYRDNKGNETIVIFNTQESKNGMLKYILNSIEEDIVSIQPLLTNITNADEARQLIRTSQIFTKFDITEPKQISEFDTIRSKSANLSIEEIKKRLYDYYNNENIAKTYAKKLSNTLYQSFVKACSITSSRIPTQALASFMDMQVAAYNPQEVNEVFVSRWQLWLQGSDLDIKKY